MAYDGLYEDEFSVGYVDQTVYDEEATVSGNWMTCTVPQPTVNREIFEERRASAQPMATSRRGIGAQSGSFSFRQLMRSQAQGFDATAGAPAVVTPELDLLAEIMGATHVGAYGAGAFAAAMSQANQMDAGAALKLGCAYAYGASASAIKGIGWVESNVSGTNFQLRHDVRELAAMSDNLYPLITLIPAMVDPTPKTFRLVGANSGQDIRFIGCMPTKVMLELDPAGQLYGEYSYDFTWVNPNGASGGLQTAAEFQTIPPFLGEHNARVVLAPNVLTDFDDGTADPDGTCDVGSLRITIDLVYKPRKCHGGYQGRGGMSLRSKTCTIGFTAPKVSEFASGGSNVFLTALEDQSALAIAAETGKKSGQLFAASVPGMRVVNEPGRGFIDGAYSYTIEGQSGGYTGDGAATNAGNATVALAFG